MVAPTAKRSAQLLLLPSPRKPRDRHRPPRRHQTWMALRRWLWMANRTESPRFCWVSRIRDVPPPSSPVPPLVALVPRSFPALFSCMLHARAPAPPATDGIRGFKNRSGRHTGCPLKYDQHQHAKSKQTNRSAFMNALHCHFGRLALRSSAGETWRIYGGHGLVDRQPVALTGIQMESGKKSTGNLTRIYRKSDQDLHEI